MKKIKIIYWILTGVFVFSILGSAIPSVLGLPYSVHHFTKVLGYPAYFLPFTGVAKLLGVVAILIPGYPRIKEWAYAGFVFDLTAAVYSSLAIAGTINYWLPAFISLLLCIGSYVYYHQILKNKAAIKNA